MHLEIHFVVKNEIHTLKRHDMQHSVFFNE